MSHPLVLCTILFSDSAFGRVGHTGPAPAPAASPAAAPGPGAAEVATVACQFTIANLDYEAVAEHPEARDGIRTAVKDMIDGAMEEVVAGPAAAPGAAPPAGPAPAGMLEIHAVPKFYAKAKKAAQSALSHGSYHFVKKGSAPAAGPAAGPAAAPGPNNVETFAALEEGPKDSVDAKAWSITPADKLDAAEAQMEKVCTPANIANALLGADGIEWKHAPLITGCKVMQEMVKPFQLDCAPHVKTIIKRFSVAYTRAQVPHAFEEACHLFESKVSFSGNHRITKWDKRVCKTATEKLMNQWQGGKGKQDYDGWCHDICELKLGVGAPQCHL